ncbi:MAG: hypothetical protein ACR2FU_23500 [Streptosporangiaceae bacterium]
MSSQAARLEIRLVPDAGADAQTAADGTRQLRRELLELDVDAVDLPRADPPPGSRGADATVLGALVVTIAQSQLLPPVLDTVRSWLTASRQRSVKLELDGDVLELARVSSDEQRRLTDAWLARHQAP